MKNLTNVALLTRNDIVTVKCSYGFGRDAKEYTYVCTQELAETLEVGDWALVGKAEDQGFRAAKVCQVDCFADIDVDADFEYCWAFQKVDFEGLDSLRESTEAVVKSLKGLQRERMRKQALESLGISSDDFYRISEVKAGAAETVEAVEKGE